MGRLTIVVVACGLIGSRCESITPIWSAVAMGRSLLVGCYGSIGGRCGLVAVGRSGSVDLG